MVTYIPTKYNGDILEEQKLSSILYKSFKYIEGQFVVFDR